MSSPTPSLVSRSSWRRPSRCLSVARAPAEVLERIRGAHALAREGLEETRRAVGVLRGEGLAVAQALRALVAEYRASTPTAQASLELEGDASLLEGPAALAVVRIAQEALTNVRKHAPGASVRVKLEVGGAQAGAATLQIRNGRPPAADGWRAAEGLADSGGGYGLQGMRERAQILGGTFQAGAVADGWGVELRLPTARGAQAGEAVVGDSR